MRKRLSCIACLLLLTSIFIFPSVILGSPLKTLIIDPGHGGRDPGAMSPSGTKPIMEKNINLEIAKELSALIREKLPKMKVILTRNQDFFVSLGDRAKLANQFLNNNAIFISIHTNSHTQRNRTVKGVEVFYHYKSNTTIENFRMGEYRYRSNLKSFGSTRVQESIRQLQNTKAKEDGKRLAEFVGEGIQMASKEPIRQIAPSNLYVVSYGIIPSILVEVGFISNDKLRNAAYLKRLAKGILLGILGYMVYEKKA